MANNVISFFSKKNRNLAHPVRINKSNKSIQWQMSLPFLTPQCLVFIRASDITDHRDFIGLKTRLDTELLLDFRSVPRLDFISKIRRQAFLTMSEIGVEYVDLLGQTGFDVFANDEDFRSFLEETLATLKQRQYNKKPIICFFDVPEFAQRCHRALQSTFEILAINRDYIADCRQIDDLRQM